MTKEELDKLLIRAGRYTARYEKAPKEVEDKLRSWSKGAITPDEVKTIMAELIRDKFVDEERFVEKYIRDKQRMLLKGPLLIRQELRMKGIDDRTITEGFAEITDEEWRETLTKYLEPRLERQRQKAKNSYDLRHRLMGTAYRRGYGADLASPVIDSMDLTVEGGDEEYYGW